MQAISVAVFGSFVLLKFDNCCVQICVIRMRERRHVPCSNRRLLHQVLNAAPLINHVFVWLTSFFHGVAVSD